MLTSLVNLHMKHVAVLFFFSYWGTDKNVSEKVTKDAGPCFSWQRDSLRALFVRVLYRTQVFVL